LPIPEIRNIKINFLYLGIDLWNNLNDALKAAKSSNILKNALKKDIIASY
jgi:hypothetical protein